MKTHPFLPLRLVCLSLFLTVLSGGFVRSASAQRNPVWSSLEAYLSDSESTYIGTVAEVSEPEPTEWGTPGVRVIIDATETLKGEKRKRVPFFVFNYPGDHMLNALRDWRRKKTPVLGFIQRARNDQNDAASPESIAQLLPINPPDTAILAPIPTVGYFSMDFRLLRTPRQILDAVRRYAKNAPKTVRLHSMRYMPDLIRKQFPYSTGGELLVPATPQLETIAKRMILTPASFLPAEAEVTGINHEEYLVFKAKDESRIRRIGVEALARFKSDSNIALLKRQLNDPFVEPEWDDEKNVYIVRKLAFETLKKWGIAVPEPELRRPAEAVQKPEL